MIDLLKWKSPEVSLRDYETKNSLTIGVWQGNVSCQIWGDNRQKLGHASLNPDQLDEFISMLKLALQFTPGDNESMLIQKWEPGEPKGKFVDKYGIKVAKDDEQIYTLSISCIDRDGTKSNFKFTINGGAGMSRNQTQLGKPEKSLRGLKTMINTLSTQFPTAIVISRQKWEPKNGNSRPATTTAPVAAPSGGSDGTSDMPF